MSVKTIRDVTFDLLRKLELSTLFGNPGSTEEAFLKNFPSDFRFVLTLHESSAVGAADGYAQATGKPAVVCVHTCAGLTNAMNNIMTAYHNKTPLIIIAGNQTREMLLLEPWLTNLEPTLLLKPWAKWAYEPTRAEDVPSALIRAYATAMQPPQGPVCLSIPLDDWDKPATSVPIVRDVAHRIGPDPNRLSAFGQLISAAKNPVLIYGSGIARGQGWNIGIKFAEKLTAPIWSAPVSECVSFPQTHPLYRGELPFAIGPLAKKLEGHDVAVVIGAPVFRYYPYIPGPYLPKGLRLLHITDDPSETARAPVGDSLLSDPVLALADLLLIVQSRPNATPIKSKQLCQSDTPPISKQKKNTKRLAPITLFTALKTAIPPEAILIEEVPSNRPDLHSTWRIDKPNSYYSQASGSLGWNLPASIGFALAERDLGSCRPIISIIGDGSFQYAIQCLWTAVQLKLPILYVVLCNQQYAVLKSFAELEHNTGVPGLDLPSIDIAALASGYGCISLRTTSIKAIKKMCTAVFQGHLPMVLEVPITKTVPSIM